MSLPVADTVAEGASKLREPSVVVAFAAAYAVQVVLAVGTQSQLAVLREREGVDLVGESLLPEELPLALDVPLGAAMLAWFVAFVAAVTVSMAALRVFAADEAPRGVEPADDEPAADGPAADGGAATDDPVPSGADGAPADGGSEATFRPDPAEGLALATARGLAAGVLLAAAVTVGLALFVVPGLFLLTVFAFTYPAIAIERRGVVDALGYSRRLTEGARLQVFGLLAATFLGVVAIAIVGGFVAVALSAVPVLSELAALGVDALGWLFAMAVLASGFDRLEAARAAEREKWEGIDDELLP